MLDGDYRIFFELEFWQQFLLLSTDNIDIYIYNIFVAIHKIVRLFYIRCDTYNKTINLIHQRTLIEKNRHLRRKQDNQKSDLIRPVI